MSQIFWQAKIWGILHDPVFKALHNNSSGRGGNSFWRRLAVMQSWVSENWDPEETNRNFLKWILQADYLASASDRGAIGSLQIPVDYDQEGLEITHLLSGDKLQLRLKTDVHQRILSSRKESLQFFENSLLNPEIATEQDIQKVFWWLWRCLPIEAQRAFGDDEKLLLMPAETRLPDSSIWSHVSTTSALAGALAGYDLEAENVPKWQQKTASRPYLGIFSFSPIQELIKASRKLRDFWAGSWILHYLSAHVCWKLARKYGPDALIYPNLFQQPLIDHWLREQYPEFHDWIPEPTAQQLLTAGFPNVIVMILPEAKVKSAMELAKQALMNEWLRISQLSLEELHDQRHWQRDLRPEDSSWHGWLKSQWQTYWTALPIGDKAIHQNSATPLSFRFDDSTVPNEDIWNPEFQKWLDQQNITYGLVSTTDQSKQSLFANTETKKHGKQILFQKKEAHFLYCSLQQSWYRSFKINVGSWWPYIFDQLRFSLNACKNARIWQVPTAFSPRSTISGLGPVVYPTPEDGKDWISEGETKELWKHHAGLFDGNEQLNATEVIKRTLPRILDTLLNRDDLTNSGYPDLTAGVAGYFKSFKSEDRAKALNYFHETCYKVEDIIEEFLGRSKVANLDDNQAWGIPWIDTHRTASFRDFHSRYLNPGWLLETSNDTNDEIIKETQRKITNCLTQRYSGNNPADWYVLAAGDGDGMSNWLKGTPIKEYEKYVATELKTKIKDRAKNSDNNDSQELYQAFADFITLKKRMGPATHGALSRALLDFSNQLVPYLTEQRYAGRLIYGGGDDVLAYTNLWEWDRWLWDIRQCFRGDQDPQKEFDDTGDYWRWKTSEVPANLSTRPLFTMGKFATISFGIVIAHHSVPLAIALENLWEAEKEAKEHYCETVQEKKPKKKDAVQTRVMYGNGNILNATAKFDTFHQWQSLLTVNQTLETDLEPALFEQAATVWQQHPAPFEAIEPWTIAFCERREKLNTPELKTLKTKFQDNLANFLISLCQTTSEKERDKEIQRWLKLAAFVLRHREIKLGNV
ncbi:type III-B CRISPR-associated protein Cas10/Cmr2 [Thermosynechococcaceae cyanobacterium BACA0444]|uniref:Type III-B CRISPR-associated protein Cas10/Cmr2 n=1 Tax=Pseudocalidococcus azoricus BACA0444 TaxID=2918990 RepID=A0AAE4JX23_9CYAN|nr:type III-B CRISPR-associated protein Cas10/Cmr2 [Pseudocalidococcus azoricus]MDS3861701.1 type III-B CRISPR-associated protein Cas10/Cmr2 [Pseudocalidococcus azoricus BACA0444]